MINERLKAGSPSLQVFANCCQIGVHLRTLDHTGEYRVNAFQIGDLFTVFGQERFGMTFAGLGNERPPRPSVPLAFRNGCERLMKRSGIGFSIVRQRFKFPNY